MQKIAVIEYQDIDEPLLKLFFEKLKIAFKEAETSDMAILSKHLFLKT